MTDLHPPGAGLPSVERGILNAFLKTAASLFTKQKATAFFCREAETILGIVDDVDYDFASQRVLVPRFQGMEDSSRNWSLFMVLNHLIRVDRDILRTIDLLHDGVIPRGEVDVAIYKPDPDCGAETIEIFRDTVLEYRQFVESAGSLRGTPRLPHPWFGPLDAHQWHCLAGFHHRIHRKQARKVAAMLGQP